MRFLFYFSLLVPFIILLLGGVIFGLSFLESFTLPLGIIAMVGFLIVYFVNDNKLEYGGVG